jgi:hypothetical protein
MAEHFDLLAGSVQGLLNLNASSVLLRFSSDIDS